MLKNVPQDAARMEEEDLWRLGAHEPGYAIAAALLRLANEITRLRREIRMQEMGESTQTPADSIGSIGDDEC